MQQAVIAPRARALLAISFGAFLVVNVVLLTMVVVAIVTDNEEALPPHLDADTAVGLRIALVILVGLFGWLLARIFYRSLVGLEVPSPSCADTVWTLILLLVLAACAYAFLGQGVWLWFPLLVLLAFLWVVASLWSLVGTAAVLTLVTLALATGVLTWLVVA
jgi:hypothetical protein